MQQNTMDCDTPEALRFFASALDRPIEGEWMRKAADEIERLRERPCPYVTGRVTRYCTLTPLTLTDAEREAVETAFDAMQYAADELGLSQADCDQMAATLRGLLDRTDTGEK